MTAPTTPKTPSHVAIIMDGNGRWAAERGLSRIEGHKAGAEAVRRTIEACSDLEIQVLTLYAFSTENWRRPPREIRGLMSLLQEFLVERLDDLNRHQIRLRAIGQLDRIPRPARRTLEEAIQRTRSHRRGTLVLALSYGGRADILQAARQLAHDTSEGNLDPESITEEALAARLWTTGLPDPELIIRTSGELRLSNFLLWQAAYAEFWVTEKYWPDFTQDDFRAAVNAFAARERRFGGIDHA